MLLYTSIGGFNYSQKLEVLLMKLLKNVTALFCLVLAFECMLLGLNHYTVNADTKSTTNGVFGDAEQLQLDVKKEVTITKDIIHRYYSFTPTVTGVYKLESSGDVDSKVYIYEDGYGKIGYDDDDGTDSNFMYISSLVAGKTYVFDMTVYGDDTGTYNAWITKTSNMEITPPTKTTFLQGETYCVFVGLSATLFYTDGTKNTYDRIEIESNNSILPFELSYEPIHIGKNTITLTYGEFSKTFTVTGESILLHKTSSIPMTLDTSSTATAVNTGDYNYYSFVPAVSGLYKLYSSYSRSEEYVYDLNGTPVEETSTSIYFLEAGKIYYFTSTTFSSTETYSVTLNKVKDIASIQILQLPNNPLLIVDFDPYNTEGLLIKINYKDTSYDIMQINSLNGLYFIDNSPIVITYDPIVNGDNKVTITYRGTSTTFSMKGITIPDKYSKADLITTTSDTTYTFPDNRLEVVKKFVPSASGVYTFKTTSKDDIMMYLYNEYGERIVSYGDYSNNNLRTVSYTDYSPNSDATFSRYLEKNKTYYLVVVNDSSLRTNSFTISLKTQTSYTVPKGVTAVYGQTLGQITLPTGFSWENSPKTVLNSVGKHTFIAKYTPVGGNKASIVSGIEVPVNVIPPVYKITYRLNGGINNKSNPSTYGLLKRDLKLNKPTRKGYIFAGWYKDSKLLKPITTVKKTSQGNISLYAKWTKVTVKTVSLNSLANTKPGMVTVSYKKISDVKGYQILCASNSKFKNAKSITSNKLTYTFSKLKKGTTYYFKVRGYKLDSTGKIVYGKYSKVIKIKLAK